MPFDEHAADRIRTALQRRGLELEEKKMFGGIAFMHHGKMSVGVLNDDLTVRVVAGKMEEASARQGVRPMDFTGRAMKEFLYVAPEGYDDEKDLEDWISLGLEHAERASSKG